MGLPQLQDRGGLIAWHPTATAKGAQCSRLKPWPSPLYGRKPDAERYTGARENMAKMDSWIIPKARCAAAAAAQEKLQDAVDAEEVAILQHVAKQDFRTAMHLVDEYASEKFEKVADAQHVVDKGSRALLENDRDTFAHMFRYNLERIEEKFTDHLIISNPSPSEGDRKITEQQLELLMPAFYAKLKEEADPYEAWAVTALFHQTMFFCLFPAEPLKQADGQAVPLALYKVDATKTHCNPFFVPLTAWNFVKNLLLPHREARDVIIKIAAVVTEARMVQAMSALSAEPVRSAPRRAQLADEARAARAEAKAKAKTKLPVRPVKLPVRPTIPGRKRTQLAVTGAAMHGVKPDGTGPG